MITFFPSLAPTQKDLSLEPSFLAAQARMLSPPLTNKTLCFIKFTLPRPLNHLGLVDNWAFSRPSSF